MSHTGRLAILSLSRTATAGCLLGVLLLLANAPFAESASSPSNENTLITEIAAPEGDVLQALHEVLEDQIIHGTQQYSREKTLYGAHSATSSSAFRDQPSPGKVFYKVAQDVLSPQNFKDSSDLGNITVRYIVQAVSPTSTNIQIDAVFIERDRRRVHWSEGVVESAEFAEIQKRLQALDLTRKQAEEEKKKLEQLQSEDRALAGAGGSDKENVKKEPVAAQSAVQELEQRVTDLQREAERRVKEPGASLKSAPFRSATTIAAVPAGRDVLVVVVTPYWYGVETQDGHRGWIHHSELETLP